MYLLTPVTPHVINIRKYALLTYRSIEPYLLTVFCHRVCVCVWGVCVSLVSKAHRSNAPEDRQDGKQ